MERKPTAAGEEFAEVWERYFDLHTDYSLFALHHVEAFPVDTHIRQVCEKHYPKGFPFEAYPGYAGIMQQYIFYYDLKKRE